MFKKTFGNYDIVEGESGDVYFVEDVDQSDWQERLKEIQRLQDEDKKKKEAEEIQKVKSKSKKKKDPVSDEIEIKVEEIELPLNVFVEPINQIPTSSNGASTSIQKKKDPVRKVKEESSSSSEECDDFEGNCSSDDWMPPVKKGRMSSINNKTQAIKSEASDDSQIVEIPEKVVKKRGRPRKPRPEVEEVKIPKKMGRPRKIKRRYGVKKQKKAVIVKVKRERPGKTKKNMAAIGYQAVDYVKNRRNFQGVPYCRYCETQFETRMEKNEHICPNQSSDDPDRYVCKTCGKELNKRAYETHCHDKELCPFCDRRIFSQKRMILHIQTVHQGKPRPKEKSRNFLYYCDFCNLRKTTKKAMLPHILTHLPPQDFACSQCDMKFGNDYDALEKHAKSHKIGSFNKFKCKFCFKVIEGRHNANVHEKNVHGYGACEICGKKTTSKKEMIEHFKSHGSFKCSFCGKEFLTPTRLYTHETRHKVQSVEGFEHRVNNTCKVCGEHFLDKSVLAYHMRYHQQLNELFCEHCGKGFILATSLRAHQRNIHEIGIKCEICRAPVKSKKELKEHMKTHGEFKCHICDKNFVGPAKLKYHQRHLHTEVDESLRVDCDFCPKRFFAKSLRSHVFRFHKDKYELWNEGIS